MANVIFKRGLQANLPSQASEIQDGAFYLTTDTDRLYIGKIVNDTATLVPVNEGVNFVSNVASLPSINGTSSAEAGHFYYASTENILCVWNGKEWVQINPDTNDDHAVYGTDISFTKVTSANASTLGIPYSSTAIQYQVAIPLFKYDLKNTSAEPDDLDTSAVGTLAINAADVAQIATQHSVGVSGTFDNNNQTITLQTNGAGSDSGATSVVLSAGNNISFAKVNANDPITISTPSIYVGASGNKIGLKQGNAGNWTSSYGSVEISATNELSAATDANGETITISHETQSGLTASTYGGITQTAITGGNYSTKTVNIPSLSVNSYGHITSATTNSYTLQEITGIEVNGTTINLYANGNTASPIASANIAAFGSYVTTSAFNTALQGLNAMTYRGTVSGTLPSTDVHNGDTYVVSGSITGHSDFKVGDILIATGTEEDGVIPSGSITWEPIQIDYNTDTQYTFDTDTASKTFTFRSTASGGNLSNYTTFAFSTNSLDISVATSSEAGNIYHNTLTFDMAWGTF